MKNVSWEAGKMTSVSGHSILPVPQLLVTHTTHTTYDTQKNKNEFDSLFPNVTRHLFLGDKIFEIGQDYKISL